MESKGIFEVLADAQAAMEAPRFDCVNPHFKSKYASLAECERVVKKACNPLGVFVHYDTYTDADGMSWLCTVIHYMDMQVRMCPVRISFAGKPQERGSEMTYCRRYSLCGAFALAADEDDDGNAAQAGAEKQPKKRKQDGRTDREKVEAGVKRLASMCPMDEDTIWAMMSAVESDAERIEWLSAQVKKAQEQLNA